VIAVAVAVLVIGQRARRAARSPAGRASASTVSGVACAVAAAVLVQPALALRQPPVTARRSLSAGATLWRAPAGADGAVAVVVIERANVSPTAVLAGLREEGVRRVTLYVSASWSPSAQRLLDTVRSRVAVDRVLAPSGPGAAGRFDGRLPLGAPPTAGEVVRVGALEVDVREVQPRVVVEIRGPPPA
jgi:hypothetical protein